MDAITEPEGPDQTLEKLVGVYRVLIPHKIAAYTYHLNNTSNITDAPTMRSLKFVLDDEFEDWRDGEMIIQSLIENEADVQRAAAHQAKCEALMVKAGGIAGPGSIGSTDVADPRGGHRVKKILPPEELARDSRFVRLSMEDRFNDRAAAPAAPQAAPGPPSSRPTRRKRPTGPGR